MKRPTQHTEFVTFPLNNLRTNDVQGVCIIITAEDFICIMMFLICVCIPFRQNSSNGKPLLSYFEVSFYTFLVMSVNHRPVRKRSS